MPGYLTTTLENSGKCLICTFKYCKDVTDILKFTNVIWEEKNNFFFYNKFLKGLVVV